MADEQPGNLSADVQTPDVSTSEPSSERSSEQQSSESPSWWKRMFSRRGDDEETDSSTDTNKAKNGAATSTSTLSLTQEELDRRVQAETDRREAKRQAEARVRERKQLRDTDPWQYAEQERKEEETQQGSQQLEGFLSSIGTEHDRVSIDPIFLTLPEAERERIQKLDGAGQGLAGRKLVVTESLKALERHWKAEGAKDAEMKLRRNQAFRKQVLSEIRGQTAEPELLPGTASSDDSDQAISALLRSHYRLG